MAFLYRDRYPGTIKKERLKQVIYETILMQLSEAESAGDFNNAEGAAREAAAIYIDESKVYKSIEDGKAAQPSTRNRYAFRYAVAERKSKAEERLEDRIQREVQKMQCYLVAHHVRNRKSKLVGCKKCGSHINKDYVGEDNKCPCCGNYLYSETDKFTLKRYQSNIDEWEDKLKWLREKAQKKSNSTMWFVSTMYH